MADFVIGVSQLNEYIAKKFARDALLDSIRVRGEITNFRVNASGTAFFTLKDAAASIPCIYFDYGVPEDDAQDGMRVIVQAAVHFHAKEAKLRLAVSRIEPSGLGELFLAFEETKKKLFEEGLFDAARKRRLPVLPATIGVVTSAVGAAVHDIIQVVKRRCPGISIVVFPARVQGAGAAEDIVRGIETLNRESDADVIIVGRGGGSFEDLFAFNEEAVARAIHASRIPVVSAVGHEVDVSIADMAADVRAATPSAAAELCAPDKQAFKGMVDALKEKLAAQVGNRIAALRWEVRQAQNAVRANSPERKTADSRAALNGLANDLYRAALSTAERKSGALHTLTARLHALNPFLTLKRGYAIVRDENGAIVSSARGLRAGAQAGLLFHDGAADAVVQRIRINGGEE